MTPAAGRRLLGWWRAVRAFSDRPAGVTPPRRILAVIAALIALLAPQAATAAPSPAAHARAAKFVKNTCPSYDPAAMDALAAVFQRTIDTKVKNGRVQFQPVQRFAAAAELATLTDYCRESVEKQQVRFTTPVSGVPTPDIEVERPGQPRLCVEVTSVTGRYARAWQYRASRRGGRTFHIGARSPTVERIEAAATRKLVSPQLMNARCGEVRIALHVAARGENMWPKIGSAFGNIAADLANAPAHLSMVHVYSRGTRVDVVTQDAAGRAAVVAKADAHGPYQQALQSMARNLPVVDKGGARGAPLSAPGVSPAGGAAINLTSGGPNQTGGIDFSSLELRYVADRKGRGLRYAFRAPVGAGNSAVGLRASQDASDAFFVWLALSPRQFWVNLNPTEPSRIIDPVFARSDAGRVLLEADLAMKKAIAPLVRPDTPGGAQFWRELEALYGARPDQACFSARQWIVPAPATVYQNRDELYILDSPLDVKMESEFVGGLPGGGCPQGSEAFETRKEGIYRRLVLPSVVRAVNTAPAFAPLRRVYTSRIAAEWFRARHRRDRSPIGRIADSGNIRRWPAVPAWNPIEVFNRYVTSVRNGEWTVERQVAVNGQQYVMSTTFGGVDFSRTPKVKVVRRQFRSRWPKLATRVRQSMRRPVTDAQGAVWFGGGST